MSLKQMWRKAVSVFLTVVLVVGTVLPTTLTHAGIDAWKGDTASSLSGSGTKADPYVISNGAELSYAVRNSVQGAHYKLKNDIYLNDVTTEGWQSTAKAWDVGGCSFYGSLDGAGYTIYGVYYNSNGEYSSLLGRARGTDMTVKNLTISDSELTTSAQRIGALFGFSYGGCSVTISRCYITESVSVTSTSTGNDGAAAGFVAYGNGTVTVDNCAFFGRVSTPKMAGSIFGNVWYSAGQPKTITNTVSTAQIPFNAKLYLTSSSGNFAVGTGVTAETGVTRLASADMMKGEAAKANMSTLDWDSIWQTTAGLPIIRKPSNINVWDGSVAASLSGSGTKADPYLITDGADLAYAVNNSAAGKYYKLTGDIYLNEPTAVNWATGEHSATPNSWYADVAVQGNFDGSGHTVYGLYYNSGKGVSTGTAWNFTDSVALFPEIAAGTTLTVKGLGVDKAYISGKQGVGAIVGAKSENNATLATLDISQCYVGEEVSLIGFDTGAFLGINRAVTTTLTNCYSLASQTAASHSGLVADRYEGTIKINNCYNAAGALDTKGAAVCTGSYATAAGGSGAIVIPVEKMQGISAAVYMSELGARYVTTEKYPALRVFLGTLDESINKIIKTEALSDEEHRELARKAVGEGLVLLKNKDSALPLAKSNTVAFFGKGQNNSFFAFGGYGSGEVYMNYIPAGPADVFAELAAEGKASIYEPLYNEYLKNSDYVPDTAMYEAAAAEADTAVIVITRKKGEGNDMKANEWILTDGEKALMQNATTYFEKVIVLLNTPSTFSVDWSLDGNSYGIDVDALLVCHAPGEMGGYGIADVMLGEVNPSGKLTDTYALSINDYPSTEGFYESADYVNYTDDIYVGYRYFETFAKDRVAYEFGYGLSYTTFDIKTDSVTNDGKNITVTATVKNTGEVSGKETVQVYFSAPQKGEGEALLSKSAIELAGFAKTRLLAPGEKQTVTITYAINDMSSYDDVGYTDYRSAYVLEAGVYDIFVGNSVKNNQKQGEYTVDTIRVTEQLKPYGEVTLEERLEADGTYTDPSMPMLKDGQTFIKSDEATMIEAEATSKVEGTIRLTENYSTNGYITDGYDWYNIPAGVVLGKIDANAGNCFYYDLVVEKAGTYKFGFVASNGNQTGVKEGKNAEDLLTLEISTNGVDWHSVDRFAYDSINTNKNSADSTKYWFNFIYNDADTSGNYYNAVLPKGAVQIRFRIAEDVSYSNTNIDKFFVIPAGVDFGIENVFAHYGLTLTPALTEGDTLWIEAENYATGSSTVKKESFTTSQAFFNTGSKYKAISGSSIGTFHSYPGGYLYYDLIVEKAGSYNVGFVSSDGSTSGKFGDNLLSIEYSADGGATYIAADSPAFDSVNTYAAKTETGQQWFNFIYTNADTEGEAYKVDLPAGKIRLRFKIAEDINGEAIKSVTNCNLDKFCLSPIEAPCTLKDVCELYGVEYQSVVNSVSAVWYEGEDFAGTGTRVQAEAFSEGNGTLHEGTVYAALPAGAVVGYFDKNTTGYAEYNLISEKAGTYNIGFTLANGNTSARDNDGKAPDVIDVLISADGGANWTKQFSIDVKYTGKDVTGALAQYWNFYYSTTDFDGVQYIIQVPEGEFKMRFACNENSPVYGGANIDKFVIYPSTMTYTEANAVAYYFNTDDNSGSAEDTVLPDPLDIDFETDSYKGITYADVLAGTATWEELIAQMSYNELIDLAYGKYGSWSYGFTGMIGFSDDAIAEKYGIYGGDTADGPQGLRMQYKNATFWPNATLQAATWNTELIYEIGEAVGEESLRNSIDMWLAPGMNIHRSPLCGRNYEYYSEDPVVSGVIAAAMVNGVESKGVSTVVKHYAVNNKESNRKFSDSRVSEKALREIYLEGFRIVIEKADPICVMSSYNKVNGEWTSTCEELLKGIMRDEWGYTGLIMSDWETTPSPSAELIGGNNCHMLYTAGDTEDLQNAVIYGKISREMLEENAYYILYNLAKMPDNAINPYRVTELTNSEAATIKATDYSVKSQRARQVMVKNSFDMPGVQGCFYEYNIDAKNAGKYIIALEYSALSDAVNAYEIYINGQRATEGTLAATGSAEVTARVQALTIVLPEGRSTVRIVHLGANDNVNYRALHFEATFDDGDLTGEGVVDIADMVQLRSIIEFGDKTRGASADIDSNGEINWLDMNMLRKMILYN